MPSLRGRIANVAGEYEKEVLDLLRSYDVRITGFDLRADHVAVYLEDDQANLDTARDALDRSDYGYFSAYIYDRLTLIID